MWYNRLILIQTPSKHQHIIKNTVHNSLHPILSQTHAQPRIHIWPWTCDSYHYSSCCMGTESSAPQHEGLRMHSGFKGKGNNWTWNAVGSSKSNLVCNVPVHQKCSKWIKWKPENSQGSHVCLQSLATRFAKEAMQVIWVKLLSITHFSGCKEVYYLIQKWRESATQHMHIKLVVHPDPAGHNCNCTVLVPFWF